MNMESENQNNIEKDKDGEIKLKKICPQLIHLNREVEENIDNYIQLEINKNLQYTTKLKVLNKEILKKENSYHGKKNDNYFNCSDSEHSHEPSSDHETEDFIDKIINMKKSIVNSTNDEKDFTKHNEIECLRRNLLNSIARGSHHEKDFSEEDSNITNESLHLKKEDEKDEKEKTGLNCIYARESFKFNKLDEKHAKYKEFFNKIIIGNLNWVEKKKSEDENFFASLIKPQKPKYLVISCSDSRVVVNEFTATEPGDIFTHRNIGNLVISTDFNCQSVLQFAVEYLKVEHILVIGHTDCGAIKAALSYEYHGLIDHWLKNIREVAEKHEKELEKFESMGHDVIVRKLIELNIREQCLNLCKSPIVQKAWDSGHDLYIHGYLFEMETGLLKDLEVVQNDWSNIQEIYKYNFKK